MPHGRSPSGTEGMMQINIEHYLAEVLQEMTDDQLVAVYNIAVILNQTEILVTHAAELNRRRTQYCQQICRCR